MPCDPPVRVTGDRPGDRILGCVNGTYPDPMRRVKEPNVCVSPSARAGVVADEPIAWRGPIVMNTKAELDLAFEEYHKGTFIKHSINLNP